MFKIILFLLTHPNQLNGRRASRWFEWRVKLGCVMDVLQARYSPARKQGSEVKLQASVTSRNTA